MMPRNYFLPLAICWLLAASCTKKTTKQAPLTDEQLSVLMAELAIAEGATTGLSGYAKDTMARHYFRQVFTMQGVTQEAYIESYYMLAEDLPRMESVMVMADSMIRMRNKGAEAGRQR
jgi:hypothetical protein